MSATQPFAPKYGSTQTLTASSTPQTTPISDENMQVRILNTGSSIAFVRIGEGPQNVASDTGPIVSVTDYPVAPGQSTTITKAVGRAGPGSQPQQLGYISAGGTTLYITTGNGW